MRLFKLFSFFRTIYVALRETNLKNSFKVSIKKQGILAILQAWKRDISEELLHIRQMKSLASYSKILAKFGIEGSKNMELIRSAWTEQHRFWHTLERHLLPLLGRIDDQKSKLSDEEYEALVTIAIFHDIVYNPAQKNNEELSAEVFSRLTKNSKHPLKDKVKEAILETIWGTTPTSKISRFFQKLDRKILFSEDISELIDYEHAIFKEYQYLDYKIYRTNRLKFLGDWIKLDPKRKNNWAIKELMRYIENRKLNIGVYAGSFNPFHLGHFDVVKKAEKVFDKIIVAVGTNPNKPTLDIEKRLRLIKESLPNHQVELFKGFLTDFIRTLGYKVTIVRGLRNSYDLNYETVQLRLMEDMYPKVNVAYFLCSSNLQHISSSEIQMLRSFEPGSEKKYLVFPEKTITEKLDEMKAQ